MAKINPWALTRPQPAAVTRTFRDPALPGAEFVLTAHPLDGCEVTLAMEQGEAYVAEWVGTPQQPARNQFPLGDGRVRMSGALCRVAALLEYEQQNAQGEPLDPENYYSFSDLIGIAFNARGAWVEMATWAQQLAYGAPQADEGNLTGADAPTSSAPS